MLWHYSCMVLWLIRQELSLKTAEQLYQVDSSSDRKRTESQGAA